MEISVGFADKDKDYYISQGYICDESTMGLVYYPGENIQVDESIVIRYMEYPWISTFEVDGIRALLPEDEAEKQKNPS